MRWDSASEWFENPGKVSIAHIDSFNGTPVELQTRLIFAGLLALFLSWTLISLFGKNTVTVSKQQVTTQDYIGSFRIINLTYQISDVLFFEAEEGARVKTKGGPLPGEGFVTMTLKNQKKVKLFRFEDRAPALTIRNRIQDFLAGTET